MICGLLDTYILAQYPFYEEFLSLAPVHIYRIRNRTIPFIVQKPAVPRVGPTNIYDIKERVKIK